MLGLVVVAELYLTLQRREVERLLLVHRVRTFQDGVTCLANKKSHMTMRQCACPLTLGIRCGYAYMYMNHSSRCDVIDANELVWLLTVECSPPKKHNNKVLSWKDNCFL